jgi:hypothetical protein
MPLKQITPADRLAQEVLRLRRELDQILTEYLAATQEEDDGGPVRRVTDPVSIRRSS